MKVEDLIRYLSEFDPKTVVYSYSYMSLNPEKIGIPSEIHVKDIDNFLTDGFSMEVSAKYGYTVKAVLL